MLEFVNKYGANVHSQNGEDGIISECLHRMGIALGSCVEIGANDGQWMSNTRNLIEKNWSGLFVETVWSLYLQCKANWAHDPHVRVQCSRVDGHNVNAFVKGDCDLLSIDTDGSDYEIFKGLKANPKIVIVEIDSSIPPDVDGFNSDGGAGYKPMVELALAKGYFLLCHTGNLILIDEQYRDLFPEITADPLSEADLYFKRDWLRDGIIAA